MHHHSRHHPSRRGFFKLAVGAPLGAFTLLDQARLLAAQARAQADYAVPVDWFDIQQVSPGAWLAVAKPAAILNSNAAIFIQGSDVVVVDTHSRPSAAAALIGQIWRQVTKKPVRYVINTHFHYDHSQGNHAFQNPSGKLDFVASSKTRELMAAHGASRAAAAVENAARNAEMFRARAAAATDAVERAYAERMARDLAAFAGEMKGWEPLLPSITFEKELVLHDKERPLHLVFRGRAHTASDISVYSPADKLVATGDLVPGFVPGMGDGFPLEWPATLDSLGALSFERILSGHGPLQEDRAVLVGMKGYIEELIASVAREKRAGRSLEAAQAAITPGTLKTLAGPYGALTARNVERYTLMAPDSSGRVAVANAVRANVGAVYTAL
ncbi:MAG: MBL fold metallo-hydrolase [Acidobacteria bacterium]|nr:MBL fold metallo-hydrolase [Acidobacteriota bacterium]